MRNRFLNINPCESSKNLGNPLLVQISITPWNPHNISSCMYVQFCHIMKLWYRYSGLILSTMVHTTQFPSSLHTNHYWHTHTRACSHTNTPEYTEFCRRKITYARHRAILEMPCSVQESRLTFFFGVTFFRNHPAN